MSLFFKNIFWHLYTWHTKLYIYIYYIKRRVHGLKTYGMNGKEALTGDWEELNKKHMYIMYVTTSRFTSAYKYEVINLLIFIFARRYSPSEKQPTILFTQFWKFSDFKSIKKKNKKKRLALHWLYLLLQRKNLIEQQNKKNVLVFCGFDCFCCSLYYLNNANRSFDGLHICS